MRSVSLLGLHFHIGFQILLLIHAYRRQFLNFILEDLSFLFFGQGLHLFLFLVYKQSNIHESMFEFGSLARPLVASRFGKSACPEQAISLRRLIPVLICRASLCAVRRLDRSKWIANTCNRLQGRGTARRRLRPLRKTLSQQQRWRLHPNSFECCCSLLRHTQIQASERRDTFKFPRIEFVFRILNPFLVFPL